MVKPIGDGRNEFQLSKVAGSEAARIAARVKKAGGLSPEPVSRLQKLEQGRAINLTPKDKAYWTLANEGALTSCGPGHSINSAVSARNIGGKERSGVWQVSHLGTPRVKEAAVHDVMLGHYNQVTQTAKENKREQAADSLERALDDVCELYDLDPKKDASFEEAGNIFMGWTAYFQGNTDKMPELPKS